MRQRSVAGALGHKNLPASLGSRREHGDGGDIYVSGADGAAL